MRMALKVFVALFAFVFTTHVSYAILPFNIGAKGGLNIANASLDNITLPSGFEKLSKSGFMAGGVVEANLPGPLSIALEILYTQKGTKLEGQIDPGTGSLVKATQTESVTSLEFPLLAKAKFGAGKVKPMIMAGPSIGIVLSAEEKLEADGLGSQTSDTKESTSSIDFGIVAGAGVEIKVAPMVSLTGEARYQLGLSNLVKNPTGNESIKSNGIQFLLGLLFAI